MFTVIMSEIPNWLILPYWVIILFAIINIISIFLESSTKHAGYILSGTKKIDDIKRRDNIMILARLYLIGIYSVFFLMDTSLDWRAFLGRWGIFALLFFDSYCNIANYVDFNWHNIQNKLLDIRIKKLLKNQK